MPSRNVNPRELSLEPNGERSAEDFSSRETLLRLGQEKLIAGDEQQSWMIRAEPVIYCNREELYHGQAGHFFSMRGYKTVEQLVIRTRENPYLGAQLYTMCHENNKKI